MSKINQYERFLSYVICDAKKTVDYLEIFYNVHAYFEKYFTLWK